MKCDVITKKRDRERVCVCVCRGMGIDEERVEFDCGGVAGGNREVFLNAVEGAARVASPEDDRVVTRLQRVHAGQI